MTFDLALHDHAVGLRDVALAGRALARAYEIGDETPDDIFAREKLLDESFGPGRFLKTCERLREGRLPAPGLALAAKDEGRLVATLRLWPVTIGAHRPALLLGPLAVARDQRSRGLGAAMMNEGLARAKARGWRAVLLVGDEPYYARFGFERRFAERLTLPGPVERERFLGLELVDGALEGAKGLVRTPVARDIAGKRNMELARAA